MRSLFNCVVRVAGGFQVPVLKNWQGWLFGIRLRNPGSRYALAVAAVVAGFVIRLAIGGSLLTPFITLWPAVMVTTLVAGTLPGVVSLALSTGLAWYCFIPPAWSLKSIPPTAVPVLAFLLWGGALLVVVKAFRITIQDLITQHERSRLLMQEVDHRVKNSLQFVYSVLRLQANSSSEGAVREGLLNAADRLNAIVRVHQQLYQSDPAREVDLRDFLDRLARDAERVMGHLEIKVQAEAIGLPFDKLLAISIILNELLTNIGKHAYPLDRRGTVRIACALSDAGDLAVIIEDEGPGLPAGFDPASASGFGMTLIRTLTRQLDARLDAANLERGARFTLTIPSGGRFTPAERMKVAGGDQPSLVSRPI